VIDLAAIDAIDVHVHAWAPGAVDDDPMLLQAAKYFGDVQPPQSLDEMADYYRSRRMACVVFTVDAKNQTHVHVTNDEVLAFAERHSDVVIPFVSVDPTRGTAGVREAERLIETGQVRGFKLHPQTQAFFANDPRSTRSTR
jgi:predicted TIM-barrel fold metal-dependent hydrolase